MLEPPLGVCPVALEARLVASCLPPTMGSIESSEGRRVSFGMDEEERVRVLQGIRVSSRPGAGLGMEALGPSLQGGSGLARCSCNLLNVFSSL